MQASIATASGRAPQDHSMLRRLALVGVAMVVCGIAFLQLLDAGSRIDDPRVLRFDAALPLGAAIAGDPIGPAMPMRLPRQCLHVDANRCERGFLLPFDPPLAGGGTLSMYIPQYTGNVAILLNGTLVADSRHDQSSIHIGQGAPLLVSLPPRLLEGDGNRVQLRVSHNGYGGFVGPVYIGQDSRLRPAYDLARSVVVILPRLVDGMLLAIGLVMLLLWFGRRHDRMYLLCGVISLCLGVSWLSSVASDSLNDHLLVAINMLRFVAAALLLPFAWLFTGREPPVPLRWFLLLPVAVYLGIELLPYGWGTWLAWYVFVPMVLALAAVAAGVFARAAFTGRDTGSLLMLAAMVAVVLMIGRDALVNAGMLPRGYVVMGRFHGPILVTMMGSLLLSRFSAGLSMLEQFNQRLRSDVEAAEERLREAFERERAHERQATLQGERMRLMGDLHDGIAGQLVSIISLSEQGGASAGEEIAGASSRALTDLRLVVDSMEDVGDDLGMTLVAFRERVGPQLRRCGVRLDWKVRALPDLPGLYPSATLAIFRLLQEAVNNAMRHSGSPVVEVSSSDSPLPGFGARLVVRDFGRGGAAARKGGHGMDSMRRRAAHLGAALAVEDADPGTRVVVDLPLRLAPATDAAAPATS